MSSEYFGGSPELVSVSRRLDQFANREAAPLKQAQKPVVARKVHRSDRNDDMRDRAAPLQTPVRLLATAQERAYSLSWDIGVAERRSVSGQSIAPETR